MAMDAGDPAALARQLRDSFPEGDCKVIEATGEVTLEVPANRWTEIATRLRDDPAFGFELLMDLCGVDYLGYGNAERHSLRFAVVAHLLSVSRNWRLRLRTFCADESLPVVDSLLPVWPSVGWYEREAFDLFGILFEGHPDLRRILTDYGFVGHPFRRDFPVSGTVEMQYDDNLKRVVYRPVSLEPREITPRVIREENYAKGKA